MAPKKRLKIAQIAPIWERVPPKKYGGTERVIHGLTEELVKMGHDVTLFASGDSQTSARLLSLVPKHLRSVQKKNIYGDNPLSIQNYTLAYKMQDQFDVIHDHTGPASLPVASISKVPVVYTLHYIHEEEVPLWGNITGPALVSISHGEIKPEWEMKATTTIYHGLKMDKYPFGAKPGKYLLFVGRIHPDKGVHYAIQTAKTLDLPLVIVARFLKSIKEENSYFEKYVKPYLNDPKITFVGELDEKRRNKLMANALCILHPITWPEPFGLTMIEAMACGCPVIGFHKGSVPEIVEDGKTGYVVRNVAQMIKAVKNIDKINRDYCRQYVLQKFTVENMAKGYEQLYNDLLTKETTYYASYPIPVHPR